jgi:hypothetical protein
MVELDLVLVRLDLRTIELISAVATLSRQSLAPARIFCEPGKLVEQIGEER